MKNIAKFVAMMAIVCVVALKAYDKLHDVNVSDVVLANVEALAAREDENVLPDLPITCSKDCKDGIGRCWIETEVSCIFSGYISNKCSHLPCMSSSDGPV